jgi:predicted AAA+ superfamily ATPase
MLEQLFAIHYTTIAHVPLSYKRYLFKNIDWNSRCICLTGARGTGKTTLLLQYLIENYGGSEKALYISADHIDVSGIGLYRIAEEFFSYGGELFIIDEVHKYSEWQQEVKSIIDTYRSKRVIISGSSSLDLKRGKADLSRRFAYYDLKGMSFREYLLIKEKMDIAPVSLSHILEHHMQLSRTIASHQKAVLKLFNKYLIHGYYPFVMEGETVYLQKLMNVIDKVFYEDISVIGNVKKSSIQVIKKLLWIIATSVSFTVNIERLSRDLGIAKEYIYNFLEYLEDAGLVNAVYSEGKGIKLARKPEKLFLENTNLIIAITGALKSAANSGAIRETFFVNQLLQGHSIRYSDTGDFLVDEKYYFEIGGKDKGFEQLHDAKHSFVAADGIEIGAGRKIPLYLFGFLY